MWDACSFYFAAFARIVAEMTTLHSRLLFLLEKSVSACWIRALLMCFLSSTLTAYFFHRYDASVAFLFL